jgi:hypothetical protein
MLVGLGRSKAVTYNLNSAARCPQPKWASPCSPPLQSLSTETTEAISDLCVRFFLVTEDTEPRTGLCRAEALLVREEIFARRQGV